MKDDPASLFVPSRRDVQGLQGTEGTVKRAFIAAIAAAVVITAGPAMAQDASAKADAAASASLPWDPAERANRVSFAIHETLDRYLFRPAALAYRAVVPAPLRIGLENVLSNLGEPVVVINDTLQGRLGNAGIATTRFVVNSTIGLGGIFDVGSKTGLPHHDNGFALTLGRVGVKPGPYLFIPFIGPTTVRDLLGKGVDIVSDPFHWLVRHESETLIVSTTVASGLDERANADADLTALMSNATDPYATLRSVYLQNEQTKIDDAPAGAVPTLPDFDDDTPPSVSPPPPSSSTASPDATGAASPVPAAPAAPAPVPSPSPSPAAPASSS